MLLDNHFLKRSIETVSGIGPQRVGLLQKELKIFTIKDLLLDFPIRHIDRTKFTPIKELRGGDTIQIKGVLSQLQVVGARHKKRLTARLIDDTGSIELVWFRSVDWLAKNLISGKKYIVNGKVSQFNRGLNIAHPEMEAADKKQTTKELTFVPVYRSTEQLNKKGIDTKMRRKWMASIIGKLEERYFVEYLPQDLIEKYRFATIFQTIKQIHFPRDNFSLKQAVARIKYEDFFFDQLRILRFKEHRKMVIKGLNFDVVGELFHQFYSDILPFELTGAQKRVLKEIRSDLKSGLQMNRLLQGDVGSGKTIVAFMSALIAIDNGYQVALMAPTEILARQHYEGLKEWADQLKLPITFLSGSVKGKDRKNVLLALKSGVIKILVGTHAIFEDWVQFDHLGMVIIDEQHRFGVAQRAKLWKKGKEGEVPHVLIMSATPIPRTLYMTAYGDLDISIIDELPPGRKAIKTYHRTEYRRPDVIKFMRQQIQEGRQVYVVFPLIEESDNLDLQDLQNGYEELLQYFPRPEYQIAVVHGKMKPAIKEEEMQRFVTGQCQILVATTVIEVGVNVPNASIMIIENAERFGLSQLHQLRGRVGRGASQSYCILMTKYALSEDGKVRIKTMVDSTDGFKIAEVDLQLRGPGDLAGTQQSGLPELKLAHIQKDQHILRTAREDAMAILDRHATLEEDTYKPLLTYLRQRFKDNHIWSQIS